MPQNTFEGAVLKFRNASIHVILAEVIKFRRQLVLRPEFQQQSGWDNALNKYLISGVEQLADTLENITYKPSKDSLEELGEAASDTSNSLAQDYADGTYSLHSDNVVMAPTNEEAIIWDLTGVDPNIPQPNESRFVNDFGRIFIKGLDNFFVQLTRLDARNQTQGITKTESVRMRALLDGLYTITQRKGGEINKLDIPGGVLPSDEPTTFKG